MPETRNTRSPNDLFKGFDSTLRHYFYDRPRAYFHVLRGKLENLPQTNFQLGCKFAEQGKWNDAMFRFKVAIYLKPDYPQAHYNLGCCYLQLHKFADAKAAFRTALRYRPHYNDALFMLSGLDPQSVPQGAHPRHMPADMITGFFTQLAPDYDRVSEFNQYHGPRLVTEAIRPFLKRTEGLKLLDLGCGTGLVAKPWRPLSRESTGIDITPAMVTAAHAARQGDNPVYERVLNHDISALPTDAVAPASQDVALCIDTAQFVGDLAPMLASVQRTLVPGGLFVLSIEPANVPNGFGVNPETGRFGHTVDYVKTAATNAGFALKRDAQVALYPALNGHLFVFEKAGAA